MPSSDIEDHWVWDLYDKGLTLIPLGTAGEKPPSYLIQRAGSVEEATAQWPKTPRERWADWQKHTPSHSQIEEWLLKYPGCNFGIVTGKEVNVVDADDEAAIEFVRNNLTRTPWVVKTGKGAHFYYQVNACLAITNSQDAIARLDTRGVGGYVVAPGSTHASGRVYQLEVDPAFPVDSVMDLPVLLESDWQKILDYRGAQASAAPGLVIGPGTKLNFDASKVAPGIESGTKEGGRDGNLVKVIGRLINDGLSVNQMFARAFEVDARNVPPLGDAIVIQKVQSVIGTHGRNNIEEIKAVPAPISPNGLLVPISSLHSSPPQWVIEGVIPDDAIGMLFGPSSGGKSFAALDIGLCIASGRDWHGRETMRSGGVIYVCGEGHQGIANRIRAWEKYHEVPVDDLPFRITRGPIRFIDDGDKKALLDAIEAEVGLLSGVALIIVDTLNRNFGDGDENSTKDMTRFIDAITDIHKATGASILIVHHTGLTDGERARGNGSLKNACDFEIKHAMKSKEGDPEKVFTLLGKKMKDGSEMAPVHFKLKTVTLGVDSRGKEYGSCAIEIDAGDSTEGAAIADTIIKNLGARQKLTLQILKDYKANILTNQPDKKQITIERKLLTELLQDHLKMTEIPPKKAWDCIQEALGKKWVTDLNGILLEITHVVEI